MCLYVCVYVSVSECLLACMSVSICIVSIRINYAITYSCGYVLELCVLLMNIMLRYSPPASGWDRMASPELRYY